MLTIRLLRSDYGQGQMLQCFKIKKKPSNNLALDLKELEKEQHTKPKISRRKEIIKIRAEINDTDTKKPQ